MKEGLTLQDLGRKLQDEQDKTRDFVAASSSLEMEATQVNPEAFLHVGQQAFRVNPIAHGQIADKLKIPRKYYQRMLEDSPSLLARNVNHWLEDSEDKRLVRTLDGRVRALLSERYAIIPNIGVATAVIPVLQTLGAQIVSCDVTEQSLYIKAVRPQLTQRIAPPEHNIEDLKFDGSMRHQHIIVDEIQPAITVKNSEVGMGMLEINPGLHTARCTNMVSWKAKSLRKMHLGQAMSALIEEGNEMAEYVEDDTRRAHNETLFKMVRDTTKSALDGVLFQELVDKVRAARGEVIKKDIPEVVELAAKRFNLNNDEQNHVLNALIGGGDFTKYGLHSAVTVVSQTVDSYDRATELEELGAKIIDLPASQWKELAIAA